MSLKFCMLHRRLDEKQVIENFSGYTRMKNKFPTGEDRYLVITDDVTSRHVSRIITEHHYLIFGFEYGAKKEELNFSYDNVIEIVNKLFTNIIDTDLGTGAYKYTDGSIIIEACCMATLKGPLEPRHFAAMERLRQEFRQESVLYVDPEGTPHFIKE